VRLLDEARLEASSVVANCAMNRERELSGSNGYGRELGLDVVRFLTERAATGTEIAWLDLCCGSGRALRQAAGVFTTDEVPVRIVGVDLVGYFAPGPGQENLTLVEASITSWEPDRFFDLITCVHGLHYIGDKLGTLARAASWLTDDGLLVANLDLEGIRLQGADAGRHRLAKALRRNDLGYDARHHRITCRGRRDIVLPLDYIGADDQAGPNYTGQPAVDSHYRWVLTVEHGKR
jgi:SAM-dependent methyltransferase